jgi:hypothetical protein
MVRIWSPAAMRNLAIGLSVALLIALPIDAKCAESGDANHARLQLAQYGPSPGYRGPPPCHPGGGAFGGAARGAARGAIIGSISGNAGRGAAMGAGFGAIRGAARRSAARSYGYC